MTWRAIFENPAALSPTQRKALALIVAEFDAMNANELARWGRPFEGFVDAGNPLRSTVERLEALGLIEVKREHIVSTSMRRGSYGRWLGGTRRHTDVGFRFRPTEKGRQVLAGLHGNHAQDENPGGRRRRHSNVPNLSDRKVRKFLSSEIFQASVAGRVEALDAVQEWLSAEYGAYVRQQNFRGIEAGEFWTFMQEEMLDGVKRLSGYRIDRTGSWTQ